MDEPEAPQPHESPVPAEPDVSSGPAPDTREPTDEEAGDERASAPGEGAAPEPAPPADEELAAPEPALPADEELAAPEPALPADETHEAPPDAEAPPSAEQPAATEKARASQEHERLAHENAGRLEREVEELREGHREETHRQYRSFFEHERRLHQLFKELRPLHAADRHRLWTAFKQIGAEARRQQQEEWEARRYLSIEARETVEEKIRAAESLMQASPGADEYRRADSILNEVRTLLSSETPGSPGHVLIGPDRRACWDRWRDVRDALRRQRSGMQEQDYQTLAGLVTEAVEGAKSDDPFRAVQRVKELQARLGKAYLRRGQFEELRRRLSEAWQASQVRIAEQRQERSKRRAEWRERMEGHLSRWRETLEHRKSQREHILQQTEKLDAMEKNARSEDFAVQVRGWKEETADKLRRVEEFIADLEQRIESATKKVGGRGSRDGGAGGRAPRRDAEGEAAGPAPADAHEGEPQDPGAGTGP